MADSSCLQVVRSSMIWRYPIRGEIVVSTTFKAVLAAVGVVFLVGVGLYVQQLNAPLATAPKPVVANDQPAADSLRANSESNLRSLWFDAERKRYTGMLDGRTCDTLVVPVQSQHSGFDRATRSLMTAQLALALASADRCVVDPYVASDALGEGMRRLDPGAVRALAASVKAKTIVTAYVGHDGNHHLEVFARVEKSPGNIDGVYREAAHKRWDAFPFTDEHAPFIVWQEKLPEILATLDLGKIAAIPADTAAGAAPPAFELPDAPEQLITLPMTDSLDAARRYELLAALGPLVDFRATERLHEKAWLAASRAPETPESRRIRARALLHLGYRPAALAVLGNEDDPAAQSLRALLDGNLPEAEAALAGITAPAEKLIVSLELRDLRFAYGRGNAGEAMPPLVQETMARSTSWNAVLGPRGGEYDGWHVDDNIVLKQVLDSLYPLDAFSIDDVVRAAVSLGQPINDTQLQLLVKRHIDRLLAQQPQRFCCSSFALRPTELDFLQLLSARSLATLEKRFRFEAWTQGQIDNALALADAYDAEYSGHPHLAALRALALIQKIRDHADSRETEYRQRATEEAHLALYLEQQGTHYAFAATSAFTRPPPGSAAFSLAYATDFPPKVGWAKPPAVLPYVSAFPGDSILLVQPKERDALAAEIAKRFHGSRAAESAVASLSPPPAGGPDQAALRASIERDPGNWETYVALVKVLLAEGDAAGAAAIADKYPGFAKGSGENQVGLSNYAAEIGSMLWTQGYTEKARAFYQRAADYETGSYASLLGAERVAIMDGDFGKAAGYAQARTARYDAPYATRDYLEFLFAYGYAEQAWPTFMASAEQIKIPEFWFAALVGKRVEGASDAAVGEWLASDAVRSIDAVGQAPALRLGMFYFLIDRAPNDNLPAMLARIEGPPVNHVDSNKSLMRPSTEGHGYTPVARSKFEIDKHDGKMDDLVPSQYVLFAPAYLALRKGDYAAAVSAFERLTNFYAIEGDQWDPNMSVALPYFAFAAAKSGDTLHLKAFLDSMPQEKWGMSTEVNGKFERELAQAYFSGLAHDTDAALKHLASARGTFPSESGTNNINAFQYAETCIWLYDETKETRYRDLALDWARSFQQMEPAMAWAYALEAAYGDPNDKRHVRAVAMALHLDRNSYWLSKVTKADIQQARNWLAHGNPFRAKQPDKTNAI